MTNTIVKGMINALCENYDKRHIKGNELKNIMNCICENVKDKNELNTIVKAKLDVVTETYSLSNKKINPNNYVEVLNIVNEGFFDNIADLTNRAKGKVFGTPEEAAHTVDKITDAIVKKLHEIYPNKDKYGNANRRGFGYTLIRVCQMLENERLIDSVARPVIQRETEEILDINPLTNYRNVKSCFEKVKYAFDGMEGIAYGTSDLFQALENELGMNESTQNNTTVLKENELNKLLVEAVTKNLKNLKEGKNDTPSNTHYAVHMPTKTICFSWDYNGYDAYELGQYRKDYFINDLVDMGMDPHEIKIWTRRTCINQGIDPTDDNSWSNYPMTECSVVKENIEDYDEMTRDYSYKQIKNMSDIEDDEELNAATETENREDLMSQIWDTLSQMTGYQNPYKYTFDFKEIADVFKQFNFDYVGPNEEEESHVFSDGNRELLLTPTMFYEKQGKMRIQNINLF
jgi:hypothetical protein